MRVGIWYSPRTGAPVRAVWKTEDQVTEGFQKMEIKRIGAQPSVKGPSEWFTGTVRIDLLFKHPIRRSFKVPA